MAPQVAHNLFLVIAFRFFPYSLKSVHLVAGAGIEPDVAFRLQLMRLATLTSSLSRIVLSFYGTDNQIRTDDLSLMRRSLLPPELYRRFRLSIDVSTKIGTILHTSKLFEKNIFITHSASKA